jgi:hypothetical protein
MEYVVEHYTKRGDMFVRYGKESNGELTGPSMCIWMVPGTWNDKA